MLDASRMRRRQCTPASRFGIASGSRRWGKGAEGRQASDAPKTREPPVPLTSPFIHLNLTPPLIFPQLRALSPNFQASCADEVPIADPVLLLSLQKPLSRQRGRQLSNYAFSPFAGSTSMSKKGPIETRGTVCNPTRYLWQMSRLSHSQSVVPGARSLIQA